jgi:hypothetical protein
MKIQDCNRKDGLCAMKRFMMLAFILFVCLSFFLFYPLCTRENRALLWLIFKGYDFVYDYESGDGVTHVNFPKHLYVTNRDVVYLENFSNLYSIFFQKNNLTSLDVKIFSYLPCLSDIAFDDCVFRDTKILQNLSNCQKLKTLYINNSSFNKEDIEPLVSCPITNLTFMSADITDDKLICLLSFPYLEWLMISDNIAISDAGLLSLCRLKTLKYLDVSNTSVTAAGVEKFKKCRPDVVIICRWR